MVVDVLVDSRRRAMTIGRLPFASETITEPTPACITTARALRM